MTEGKPIKRLKQRKTVSSINKQHGALDGQLGIPIDEFPYHDKQ